MSSYPSSSNQFLRNHPLSVAVHVSTKLAAQQNAILSTGIHSFSLKQNPPFLFKLQSQHKPGQTIVQLNIMALLDQLTEPYRHSLESAHAHYVSLFSNEIFAEFAASFFITVIFYWALGSLYAVIDFTERPRFLFQYKIQKTSQLRSTGLGKLCRQILFNQTLQTVLSLVLYTAKYRYTEINRTVPTLSRFLFEFLVFNICREITFYYSHRWLHHPSLYKHIHKRHHEWQTPVALTAAYAHPIEHFLSNIFPVIIGPLLLNSHALSSYIWMAYVVVETISAHSGYQFPLNPISPVFHDFHHLKFNTNYGIFGILDWFHGTDITFRKSKYYKLHRTYFTFAPPSDLRYDADKMK